MQGKRFGGAHGIADDEFLDEYGDEEYGDEEYGSQSQGQYYYGDNPANAAMLEGSGGSDEYDGEDISDESGLIRQHFIQQQVAAARAQAQNKKGFGGIGAGAAGAKPGFIGGGAPGFAQQAKPQAAGGFAYGAAGAGGAGSLFGAASAAGGGTSFASGLGGVGAMGGMGGGIGAMGSMGGAGNLFAAPAKSAAGPAAGGFSAGAAGAGGFAFGAASQFGGIGAGGAAGGLFGAGAPMGGAAAADDPYNIPLDLTKIKRAEKPAKTYEEKTQEEKAQDFKSGSTKYGASIMKNPGNNKKNTKNITFGQCLIYEYDKDPESNAIADRVDSKDISDMRDEKTKLRDQLQAQENEQLAQIKATRDMMKKKTAKSESPENSKFKSSASISDKIEDSIGESQSLSHSKGKNITESYDTDTFEDQSASASKQASDSKKGGGIQYWPGKDAVEISVSVSQSRPEDASGEQDGVLSANAMEEYMKKKMGGGGAAPTSHKASNKKDDVGSSGGYTDEDFESISKSQSHQLPSVGSRDQKTHTAAPTRSTPYHHNVGGMSDITQKYVKKENKFTMTEQGKYNFTSKDDSQPTSAKEWTLKRNLEDAEILIQEQRHEITDLKQNKQDQDIKMKQREVDYKTAKRESANSNATCDRLKEQLKDYMHKINLYKIETEDLIKQIDLADAKTREKDGELHLMRSDYDNKMKLQEERILMRRSKADDRGQLEIRRQNQITVDELKNKMEEKDEEIDYLKTRLEKLETENHQVRTGKGDNKRQRELENEVEMLKVQLEDVKANGGGQPSLGAGTSGQAGSDLRNIKKQLSQDEQVQIQKDNIQLELIVKSYMDENQKAMKKQKELEIKVKDQNEQLQSNERLVKEYQLKALKERKGIFVEEDEDEVNIQAKNIMGSTQSISKAQLEELYNTLKVLQSKADYSTQNLNLQASQFKAQIHKLREEKQAAEKTLYDTEFQLGENKAELERQMTSNLQNQQISEEQISELQEKITWFRENQKLLSEDDGAQKSTFKELNEMKLNVAKAKDDKKRVLELEKKCRLLEDTLKSKNPNSIGMLIQASKTEAAIDGDFEGKRELQEKVNQLKYEIDTKDSEFEKKLRAMRQEQERIKAMYEARAGNSGDSKMVKQLEDELAKCKSYYNKRIREVEDKYKYGMGKQKDSGRANSLSGRSNKSDQNVQVVELQELNAQLTKERNHFAQKIGQLEQRNQLQKQRTLNDSIQESPQQNKDLNSLFYQQQDGDSQQSPPKPPKPSKVKNQSPNLNPFSFSAQNDSVQQKSIPDILSMFSNINFKMSFGTNMTPKINQLYTIMTSDLGLKLAVSDLKSLNRFLQSRQSQNDDVEFLDQDEDKVDLLFLKTCLPGQAGGDADNDLIDQLRRENRSLKQQVQNDDNIQFAHQNKLKSQLIEYENDRRDLQSRVNKLESQKTRLESVFKSTMKGGNMDLIDEVQLLVRRIEFLEEQTEKRSKNSYMENQEPYLREIEMLRSKLTQERQIRESLISKKNAEVSYFKAELDALLSEMQNQFKKKQARGVQ